MELVSTQIPDSLSPGVQGAKGASVSCVDTDALWVSEAELHELINGKILLHDLVVFTVDGRKPAGS
jgi:hypothetical protein